MSSKSLPESCESSDLNDASAPHAACHVARPHLPSQRRDGVKPPLDEAAEARARFAKRDAIKLRSEPKCASELNPAKRRATLSPARVPADALNTRHLGLNDYSESALAQRFVERHAHELRYCAAWSKWLRYDGVRWQVEPTLLAFDQAHAVCREAASECGSKAAVGIASAHTVAAVTTLARADRRLAAVVDQWDADPWLLNTPGGTVNLRTGDVHPPEPTQYLT